MSEGFAKLQHKLGNGNGVEITQSTEALSTGNGENENQMKRQYG